MLRKNVYIVIASLFFACSNKSNITSNNRYLMTTDDSVQIVPITTDEFISFWYKFSDALLKNKISVLDSLIDNNFYGCYNNFLILGYNSFNIFEILNIDFAVDTVISKPRFLKEFRNSLNPIYLQLLEQYDVREDIKPKMPIKTVEDFLNRYRCMKEIGNNRYIIGLPHENINENDKVSFTFNLRIKNDVAYEEIKSVDLIFYKVNDEIKLCEIDFFYSWVVENPLE